MNVTGGARVPITVRSLAVGNLAVRGLAATPLARGGSIEVDANHVRDRAVSWIALALLLTSWNVEARLEAETAAAAVTSRGVSVTRAAAAGYDWTRPRPTRWTSCAARG
jgi:hypothetical protein